MAQPLNETQVKRVEDAVAKATASIDCTTRPLQEASETLRELKLELERAKIDAAQGLSAQEPSARQALEAARASEDTALRALQAKESERASLEQQLKAARALLDQGDKDRESLEGQMNTIKAEKLQLGIDKLSLAAEVSRLKAQLEHEITRRTNLSSASDKAAKSLVETQKQWDQNLQKFQAALKARGDAGGALLSEKSAHEVVQRELSEKSEAYNLLCEEQAEESQTHNGMLEKETLALKESKKKVESLSNELHELKIDYNNELRSNEQSEKRASDQLEAVGAFLKHLQGASLVGAPSVQEMKHLHRKCKESSTEQALPAFPPIVVSAGHLPGPWSYLSFASRGVLTDSRFNSVITPAVSFDLPWVFDALNRVIKEVVASTEPVSAVVLVVLLQGIAYVQAALKVASKDVILTPRPSTLLQDLSDSDKVSKSRESVVGIVHEQVKRFIHDGIPIESWIPTTFEGKRLSSANSALPEGVVLIHQDTPGTIFMIRQAADKEQLFIIDAQSVGFNWGNRPDLEMRLPAIDGLPHESREMMLMNDDEQWQIAEWAYSLLPADE